MGEKEWEKSKHKRNLEVISLSWHDFAIISCALFHLLLEEPCEVGYYYLNSIDKGK